MIMITQSRVSSQYNFVSTLYTQAIIVAYALLSFSSTSKTKCRICSHFQDDLVSTLFAGTGNTRILWLWTLWCHLHSTGTSRCTVICQTLSLFDHMKKLGDIWGHSILTYTISHHIKYRKFVLENFIFFDNFISHENMALCNSEQS